MAHEVRIPDIGDIDEVEVIEICVAPGDRVEPDDALIVIESDKASMEVPAGIAGTVASIDVAVGDRVAEGALIVTLDSTGTEDSDAPSNNAPAAKQAPVAERAPAAEQAPAVQPQKVQADATQAQPTITEVRVPDIGEATDVVVIEVAVSPGTEVSESDLLVVVESDKASMEIPAGQAGVVKSVHVEEGSEVSEGTLIATIESAVAAPVAAPDRETAAAAGSTTVAPPSPAPANVPASTTPEKPVKEAADDGARGSRVYASPAVRRLARELGVNLAEVKGSGARGRILKDDVKQHVKSAMTAKVAARDEAGSGIPAIPPVDFSRFGPVEISAMSRIQVAGAANLHRSWLNIPHVTQFEDADVTELEKFRKTLKEEASRRDVKITPLAFIIKACCYALQEFPTFNASLDAEIRNFIVKKYYHIGFAVDTPDGLVVPVIRDADRMGVWDLSEAIAELADKARTGKLGMSDMQGGSFSVSSLGNIGGTGFTPVINAPEVAILGVSRLVTRPVWNGVEFEPRQMLPLSLSYDHRAINGAEGGRFVAMLAELLGDIRRLAL